jgi:5-methylthioadenosine/S-adenosylhomocysteine deaminase
MKAVKGSAELLIKGGHVVTVGEELGDLPGADILLRDGVIAAVGRGLSTSTKDAEMIDATGRLIIPGLIDTHRHVWQGAIGAFTPQMTGAGYDPVVLNGISTQYSPEDIYAGTLWGALQALDTGTRPSPTGRTTSGRPSMPIVTSEVWWSQGFVATSCTGGLVRRRIPPIRRTLRTPAGCAINTSPARFTDVSAERNAQDFAFARELGLPISMHVGMAGTSGAILTLDRFKLLGADVNYAHGNMLADEEFDLIAKSRGTLSLTPSTDMLMQFGTFPGTGRALERGIRCGFGIDTICSAGNDLFSEMRLALAAERSRANAAALARGERVPTVALHQRDMLRLATLDGARVWNMQGEIGSLTPGKQADVTVIDIRSPHLDGFGDSVAAMVLGAGPADVETVIVGGDVVKRDGKLVGTHVEKALQLMRASRERLRSTLPAAAAAQGRS